jgi:hypothetical protein
MKYITLTVILLTAVVPVYAAGPIVDCECRAKGVVAFEGEVVCLSTPNGPRLARCEKILNNTSWRFLAQNCREKITNNSPATIQPVAFTRVLPRQRFGTINTATTSAATE